MLWLLFAAASSKLSTSSGGSSHGSMEDAKSAPRSPLKKLTRLFRRQTSEPANSRSSGSKSSTDTTASVTESYQIFGRELSDICTPDLPRPIIVSMFISISYYKFMFKNV